jgi:hypothetical protein
MMQLLFATVLSVSALAELHILKRSTFTGQQGTLASVSVLGKPVSFQAVEFTLDRRP